MMNIFFFRYKVKWVYEGENIISEGLTCGATWEEAVKHISYSYGENEIIQILLLECVSEGGPCAEFEELNDCLKFNQEKK